MSPSSSLRLSGLQRPLLFAALVTSVLVLSACASVDAQTTAYVGVEHSAPITQVEQKLREEGAKPGADAVVVVYDRTQPVTAYVTGPLWSRDIETIQGRS